MADILYDSEVELSELLHTPSLDGSTPEIGTLMSHEILHDIKIFEHCLREGGYATADAIQVLETYYGMFGLNSDKEEDIVASLERLEAAAENPKAAYDDQELYFARLEVVTKMLRMAIEAITTPEDPHFKFVLRNLFLTAGKLAVDRADYEWAHDQRGILFQETSTIIREELSRLVKSNQKQLHAFFDEIREGLQHPHNCTGQAFQDYFVRHGYCKSFRKGIYKQIEIR